MRSVILGIALFGALSGVSWAQFGDGPFGDGPSSRQAAAAIRQANELRRANELKEKELSQSRMMFWGAVGVIVVLGAIWVATRGKAGPAPSPSGKGPGAEL
jgi:hypothetical protein